MAQQRLSMRSIREVLRLKHEFGRSYREIASAVGVSVSTVSPVREAGDGGRHLVAVAAGAGLCSDNQGENAATIRMSGGGRDASSEGTVVSSWRWGRRGIGQPTTGFPEGWRQGGVCPAASMGDGRILGTLGPGRAVLPRIQRFRGVRRSRHRWTSLPAGRSGLRFPPPDALTRARHAPVAHFNPASAGPPRFRRPISPRPPAWPRERPGGGSSRR